MIHLDHNHASPHAPSNLILDDTSPVDQQGVPSWTGHPHNDVSFYQDSEHHDLPSALSDVAGTDPVLPLPVSPPANPTPPPATSSSQVDAETVAADPKDITPSSPAPVATTSPAVRSSSSLTPPPDANSPTLPNIPASGPLDGDAETTIDTGETDDVGKASRASTPLSELSSAPDEHPSKDETDGEKAPPQDGSSGLTLNQSLLRDKTRSEGGAGVGLSVPVPPASRPNDGSSVSKANSVGPVNGMEQMLGVNGQLINGTAVTAIPLKPNPKVVAILELNTHLLRVFMECQAHKIPNMDPRCQEYSARLQSNLTWLAAAADEGRRVSLTQIALPNMQPPPALEFVSTDRIHQIYAELPALFQKDIMRRDHLGNVSSPSQGPTLKRDRPDELLSNPSAKRRDTGDAKISPFSMNQPPSLAQLSGQASSQNASNSLAGGAPMQLQSGLMGPPGLDIGVAGRQMRPMSHPHIDGRQASPPSASLGPVSVQLGQAQASSLASLGPAAIQQYQILQNPSHPMVQYLHQTTPNFSSLPVAQQLQRLQTVQAAMRQQSQQRAVSHAKASSPNGFGPGSSVIPSIPPVPSTPAPQTHMGPTRVSPTSNAFPHAGQPSGSSMDPRGGMNLAQQQASLASLNPQQRQLLLMQQHFLRNGGGSSQSGAPNPQMLSGSQDRVSRMGPPSSMHPHGMPSHGGGMNSIDPSAYSALKSQSLARGSDPMLSSRVHGHMPDEFQNNMSAQIQQQGMAAHGSNSSHFSGSSGGGVSAWSPQASQAGQSQLSMGMTPPGTPGMGSFGASGQAPGPSWGAGSAHIADGIVQGGDIMGLQQSNSLVNDPSSNDLDSIFDWGQ